MTESYKRLYKNLRDSEFGCVPPGFQETEEVYELVQNEYPHLCDDSVRCRDICGADHDQAEWKHRVRTVQQDLVRNSASRVRNLSDGWYYGPQKTDVAHILEGAKFKTGELYNRWELHDVFGGQRYSGIATPAEHPLLFIFTGDSSREYGYKDEFLPDGAFLYTGEGAEGDMRMERGNKAIRNHQSNNEDLYLFEGTEWPWIVVYIGQFEYAGHQWDTLLDREGEQRNAIRFRLEPVGGTEIQLTEKSLPSLSDRELFEKAKESAPTNTKGITTVNSSSSGRTYLRSEVVREFALREAEGVCQGCGEKAPFVNEAGEPFLEVHHLHRRSDGGPDDPENVVALCPNCHRRVHHGQERREINRELIEKAQNRNERYKRSS